MGALPVPAALGVGCAAAARLRPCARPVRLRRVGCRCCRCTPGALPHAGVLLRHRLPLLATAPHLPPVLPLLQSVLPRFFILAARHDLLAPHAGALGGGGAAASAAVVSVTLRSMAARACMADPVTKRLPLSMTVAAAKQLMARLFKVDVALARLSTRDAAVRASARIRCGRGRPTLRPSSLSRVPPGALPSATRRRLAHPRVLWHHRGLRGAPPLSCCGYTAAHPLRGAYHALRVEPTVAQCTTACRHSLPPRCRSTSRR